MFRVNWETCEVQAGNSTIGPPGDAVDSLALWIRMIKMSGLKFPNFVRSFLRCSILSHAKYRQTNR